MGPMRSASNSPDSKLYAKVFFGLVALLLLQFTHGVTNPSDVAAINSLYAAFGSPMLPNWVSTGGDPCGEAWQGVQCDPTNNIISIKLVAANLGGGLSDNLGSFSSMTLLDLSNNLIGGSIPTSLPVTIVNFYLSGNNFTGSIPSSLSTLTVLSALKLNNNHLSGEIPDAFQSLSAVTSIDLSSNNLSGELPVSMESLSAIASLHLQDNQLSGPLDVLVGLPLQDLDIRNNLFSGPIPDKLLAINNFKKDGNPFNTSTTPISPSPSASSPATSSSPPFPITPSPSGSSTRSPPASSTPPSGRKPSKQANSPSSSQAESGGNSKSLHTKKIVVIAICSAVGFVILILALLLCLPSCFSKSWDMYHTYRREDNIPPPYKTPRENPPHSFSAIQPSSQIEDVEKANDVAQKDPVTPEPRRIAAVPKPANRVDSYSRRMGMLRKQDSELSDIDISMIMSPPPPPPPPPLPLAEKLIVTPIAPVEPATRNQRLQTSVRSFSIASLQQYTNSFSQDNLLGTGMLGSVYRAEHPNGKLLAVKKLDKGVTSRQKDYEFIELVNNIDLLRNANIVELVGYCMEHGQRLLVYEYCGNGTLQDALHSDDEYKKQLSWNTRMRMALAAARALEYLHEVCEPPVVHRNFKSNNILLDDDLSVRVSDCGLAPLIASGAVSQLSGHLLSAYGYGAPEFESGIYTTKSDVYSFGVVMLELLTGRTSYDRTRSRGEQFLVRWAVPQLHDIDALTRMVDPSLEGEYPVKSLSHFADIISSCVKSEPEFRPSMSEVVQDLQSMLQRGSPTKTSSFRD